jgi:UDP-glucose 4-epimerase
MKVLVTGGAGYIGSHVVKLLVGAGHDVTVLDSLEKGHREAVHPSSRFVQGDIGDRDLLDQLLAGSGFEAVLHFAAYIEAGESMEKPERFLVNNTARPYVLLEAMVAHGVPRFIFSSTAAIFGDPEYTPIDEAHPKKPTNAYGFAKYQVELGLAWVNRLRGMGVCCLRYFNASGCSETLGEDHRPETHLIPLMLQVARGERSHLYVYGTDYPTPDGTCVRDYIHVLDLAKAHLLALEALRPGEWRAYNLGNGQGYSVRQVLETVRRVTGHPIPVVEAERRPGDPAILVASSARIRRELGWVPEYADLEHIVESAWKWKEGHPQGYATVGHELAW